jgi:DNA-binding NarL/FixJ family response regulator
LVLRLNHRMIPFLQRQAPTETHGRIRLVLVDDEVLLRTCLSRVFASEPEFELVGECAAGSDAVELLRSAAADLALMDFDAFMSDALRAGCRGKFLVIAGAADARDYAHALKLGASGIFLKSESAPRLVHAARAVAHGEVWIDPHVIQLLADRVPLEGEPRSRSLTERERKVLDGIVGGLSNRKIGDSMGLSEGSVKGVVQQLFEKAGVRTRGQLVKIAMEHSL